MKTFLIHLFMITLFGQLTGQWDQYEAVWRGKPGKMLVNMDIKKLAPIEKLNFLLEITQRAIECNENGYPSNAESKWSDIIAMSVDSQLSDQTYVENVGRLTYQCDIKDYFYIQDTSHVKELISKNFDTNISYKIKLDSEWNVYKDFIYPDAYLIQTMDNGKIIKVLKREGFDLDIKSLLTHYASFASEVDRNKFRRFLTENNFKVGEQQFDDTLPFPYLITFTRRDKLQLEQLSNITLRIYQRTNSLNGAYDGWEIEVE